MSEEFTGLMPDYHKLKRILQELNEQADGPLDMAAIKTFMDGSISAYADPFEMQAFLMERLYELANLMQVPKEAQREFISIIGAVWMEGFFVACRLTEESP